MDRPSTYAPRGMRLDEAARYVGVSPSKFTAMVADGRMPKPKEVDSCRVWDRQDQRIHRTSTG